MPVHDMGQHTGGEMCCGSQENGGIGEQRNTTRIPLRVEDLCGGGQNSPVVVSSVGQRPVISKHFNCF